MCIPARTCLFFFLAIVLCVLDDDGRRKEYKVKRGNIAASPVHTASELENRVGIKPDLDMTMTTLVRLSLNELETSNCWGRGWA